MSPLSAIVIIHLITYLHNDVVLLCYGKNLLVTFTLLRTIDISLYIDFQFISKFDFGIGRFPEISSLDVKLVFIRMHCKVYNRNDALNSGLNQIFYSVQKSSCF